MRPDTTAEKADDLRRIPILVEQSLHMSTSFGLRQALGHSQTTTKPQFGRDVLEQLIYACDTECSQHSGFLFSSVRQVGMAKDRQLNPPQSCWLAFREK
jgi:hypothetical protein